MTPSPGDSHTSTTDESMALEDEALDLEDEALATFPSSLAANLLADRVVIVSGGGSGIGRATAWLAARARAQVIVSGRVLEKLTRVSAALMARGLRGDAIAADIRDRVAVDALFTSVLDRYGRIDLLVNSAGGQFPQAAIDCAARRAGTP